MHFLLLIITLFLPLDAHKFYESLTDMVYNEESHRIEVSSRYFIDDLEIALGLEEGEQITASADDELQERIGTYLTASLRLELDEKQCPLEFLGFELENDLIWVYMESAEVKDFEKVVIQATQLSDVFEDQKNIVHFTVGGSIQSLCLGKALPTGTLLFIK